MALNLAGIPRFGIDCANPQKAWIEHIKFTTQYSVSDSCAWIMIVDNAGTFCAALLLLFSNWYTLGSNRWRFLYSSSNAWPCSFSNTLNDHAMKHIYIYSKTSDSGPSKIGTQYNRPLNKGRFSRSQIIGLPIVLIHVHFEPPRRGQPLYKGQNTLIYIGPKVSFVRRFGCIHISHYAKLLGFLMFY